MAKHLGKKERAARKRPKRRRSTIVKIDASGERTYKLGSKKLGVFIRKDVNALPF